MFNHYLDASDQATTKRNPDKTDSKKTPPLKLIQWRSYGWVSYLHRAATTNYLCCGQALEDSLGAGRIGLTHIFVYKFSFFKSLFNHNETISSISSKSISRFKEDLLHFYKGRHLCFAMQR